MGGIWLQVMVSPNGVLGNDSSSHGRRRPDLTAPGLGQVNDARLLSLPPPARCPAVCTGWPASLTATPHGPKLVATVVLPLHYWQGPKKDDVEHPSYLSALIRNEDICQNTGPTSTLPFMSHWPECGHYGHSICQKLVKQYL